MQDAVKWCLVIQDALMWQDWPEALLKIDKAKEERDDRGDIVFRGPRLRMGMCHGCPRAIVPDHNGRADYHGASINSAARYMDAAAHGGQLVCEEETAAAMINKWNNEDTRTMSDIIRDYGAASDGPPIVNNTPFAPASQQHPHPHPTTSAGGSSPGPGDPPARILSGPPTPSLGRPVPSVRTDFHGPYGSHAPVVPGGIVPAAQQPGSPTRHARPALGAATLVPTRLAPRSMTEPGAAAASSPADRSPLGSHKTTPGIASAEGNVVVELAPAADGTGGDETPVSMAGSVAWRSNPAMSDGGDLVVQTSHVSDCPSLAATGVPDAGGSGAEVARLASISTLPIASGSEQVWKHSDTLGGKTPVGTRT